MASLAAWAVHPWVSPPALQWATWVAPVARWVVLQAATWAAHPLDKWAAWLAQVDISVAPVDPWAAWVAPAVRWVPWAHPAPWADQAAIKWVVPAALLGKWEQV